MIELKLASEVKLRMSPQGAKLHAKLRIELTTELFRACSEARKGLAAKLKDSSLIELMLASEAKLRNEHTTELF